MSHNVEQAVVVGYLYHINPSEIHTYIEPGIVKVTDLYIGSIHHKEDILGFIAIAPTGIHVDEDTLWVNYIYIHDDINKIYTLPIEIFKEHIIDYTI